MAYITVIERIDELIDISEKSEEGFRLAADNVNDPTTKKFFQEIADCIAKGLKDLIDVTPEHEYRASNLYCLKRAVHRTWINLKASVSRRERIAILRRVERNRELTLAKYRNALYEALPTEVHEIIENQIRQIQRSYEHFRLLRTIAVTEATVTA